jgi:arabinose-5-phosphate isomerase
MVDIKKEAIKLIQTEMAALNDLSKTIDDNFEKLIQKLENLKGKIIISGVGKSGLIAKKIAATLSSTGTPCFFLHPTDCMHVDLGVLSTSDIGLFLSFSGETFELLSLVSVFKRRGLKIISFTARKNSTLAKNSDYALHIPVLKEACPLGIVPTSSTTCMLALGDAISICLLLKKGFTKDNFAELHPGGNLGKKLLLKVSDLMYKEDHIPLVNKNAKMKEALIEMTSKKIGVTAVSDDNNNLIGIITDGDLRRHLKKSKTFLEDKVTLVMSKNPKVVQSNTLAVEALKLMETYKITHLFVIENIDSKNKKVIGVLHIHKLLEEKLL